MWDAMDFESSREASGRKARAGTYDHLIDAEREALGRSGRKVGKIDLIKALRGATSLGLREAMLAVEGYLDRREGATPAGADREDEARPGRWIDDLLGAERASAARLERPVNQILLIKALRGASPDLTLREAKLAVEDYLRRRGGEDLPVGPGGRSGFVAVGVVLVVMVAAAWLVYRSR